MSKNSKNNFPAYPLQYPARFFFSHRKELGIMSLDWVWYRGSRTKWIIYWDIRFERRRETQNWRKKTLSEGYLCSHGMTPFKWIRMVLITVMFVSLHCKLLRRMENLLRLLMTSPSQFTIPPTISSIRLTRSELLNRWWHFPNTLCWKKGSK